jgi:hypothetical protein
MSASGWDPAHEPAKVFIPLPAGGGGGFFFKIKKGGWLKDIF